MFGSWNVSAVEQQARAFYEFVTEGQDLEAPVEGDVTDLVTNIEPTETPFAKGLKKGNRK